MSSTLVPPRLGSTGFHYKRISWAAIFAGTLVALGIQLLLSLLGIGMGAMDPIHDRNLLAGTGMGTGTFIWGVVTLLVALFLGGWVSGKLSRTMNRFESIMHGVLTWIIFVLFNFYLLTSIAGGVMNAAGGIAGNTVLSAGHDLVASSQTLSDGWIQKGGMVTTDISKSPRAIVASSSKAGIYAFAGLLLAAVIAGVAANLGRGIDFRNEYEPAVGGNREYITSR
jgi:hypothetical protein